ncbi:MAG: 23S rRNA (guanosine(2251)-2'-O)-methyltransferase RlmB [Deltaproteobacteria bacterium]|nr:23S rRNA (guanosine(2251)-2'-O)-methyltransferase RlmB [Deltaproteobacteria bacterium]
MPQGQPRTHQTPKPGGGGVYLYGVSPVESALRSAKRILFELWIKEGRHTERVEQLLGSARRQGLKISPATHLTLENLCGSSTHQGVVLRCAPLAMEDESALMERINPRTLVVALDEVEDPQNLGAIARNCLVFGAQGLVLPRRHSAPLSPAASKASAGALEILPIYEAANLARFLELWRKNGYSVVGAVMEGDTPLDRFEPDGPLVVVLGNEGRGLRPLVEKSCDVRLSIPTGSDLSLNVASASAVLLYHLTLPYKNRMNP